MFPLTPQRVPIRFPMCFPRGFPVAPRFNNPIRFAESPPLLTYIDGSKGNCSHFSIESSILGEPPKFQPFFCNEPIKLACSKNNNNNKLDWWGTPN
jgi:hypothetical protein